VLINSFEGNESSLSWEEESSEDDEDTMFDEMMLAELEFEFEFELQGVVEVDFSLSALGLGVEEVDEELLS